MGLEFFFQNVVGTLYKGVIFQCVQWIIFITDFECWTTIRDHTLSLKKKERKLKI